MAEILYTGLVSGEKMQQIVASCRFTPEAFFLAELFPIHFVGKPRESDNLLTFTFFNNKLRCADYTSGRIFQADRELRWEREGQQLRVIYLGAAENEAGLVEYRLDVDTTLSTLTKKTTPTWYYLFGERLRQDDLQKLGSAAQPGDFAVVRIPRLLRYPVKINGKRYARLAVCEYLEEATDRVVLFRFQGLEAWEQAK